MSKSFNKFKRRVRAQAIASAVLLGLGAGLASLAVFTLVAKFAGGGIEPFYYAAFGGGAALVALILYFLFMPSDMRLAKRLDSVYSLGEKVATMVELRDDDGAIAALQREDADVKLGEKPAKMLKSRALISGLLVFFIAAGSALGAWVMPARADSGEAPIDEFDRQWLITAIGELITTVENAYIAPTLKESVLTELRSLLAFIEGSQLLSEMKTEAIKTVIAINEDLKAANSAEAIGVQLATSLDTHIAALGKAMSELSGTSTKKAMEAMGSAMAKGEESDASFAADELNTYLQRSGVRTDDELHLAFKSLVATLKTNYKDADDAFESAAKSVSSAVVIQNVNRATMNVVINKLCELFGITESDIATVDPEADIDIGETEHAPDDSPEAPDDDDENNQASSGGLGTGEVIYGSNDLVFDPYTNTYRPYGEIINDYFVKANEQITDGKTSDEISDAVEEYFDALFGGAGKN